MAVLKDSKRNTWFFRIYINDKYGNRKQKCRSGFRTKSEAKLAEQDFLNNGFKEENEMTFQELYDEYLLYKMQTLKSQSIRSIKSKFNNYILPYFGAYQFNKIDHKDYIKWKNYIISKNFGYKYNAGLHGSMVSILNYAIDFYDLEKNIASKIGNFSKKEYIRKINFWTLEEFQQYISFVNDNVYMTLYHTLFFTGIRIGEALALNWHDIIDNCIKVNKTLSKEKKDIIHVITTPKTKSSIREIQLDDKTLNLLQELKEYYKTFINFSEDWFVFGGLYPLSQTTVGRRKNEYCTLSNSKQIKIHDFRHSHATFLLSRGIPITVISKRLGHADISNIKMSK